MATACLITRKWDLDLNVNTGVHTFGPAETNRLFSGRHLKFFTIIHTLKGQE